MHFYRPCRRFRKKLRRVVLPYQLDELVFWRVKPSKVDLRALFYYRVGVAARDAVLSKVLLELASIMGKVNGIAIPMGLCHISIWRRALFNFAGIELCSKTAFTDRVHSSMFSCKMAARVSVPFTEGRLLRRGGKAKHGTGS